MRVEDLLKYFKKECTSLRIDANDMTRVLLIQLLKNIGLKMSYLQATEAFLDFKGESLEKSKHGDLVKLCEWILDNIQSLRKTRHIKNNSNISQPSNLRNIELNNSISRNMYPSINNENI